MSRQKMPPSGRRVLKAVNAMVAAANARVWVEDPPGVGHQRLVIARNGQTRFTPISGTPRDMDVMIKKKLGDVRRLLEEMQ